MTLRRAVAVGLAVLAFGAGFLGGRAYAARTPDLSRFASLIEREAQLAGLDADLLAAVVAAESGGDPRAVSGAGAVGLCQLMPATATEEASRLGIEGFDPDRDLVDPELNVKLGAAYLARQLRRFEGDLPLALAAYNAGATHSKRWARRAPDVSSRDAIRREGFPETRGFVGRVLRLRGAYR